MKSLPFLRCSRLPLLLSVAALLGACAAGPNGRPATRTALAEAPAPTADQINSGIGAVFLRLEQRNAPPARCDAALYGTIAAMTGAGLCVCQPQSAAAGGEWVRVPSGELCWPANQ
jgi:hypothetical protein